MSNLQKMIKKARRRVFFDHALQAAGLGLLIGCAAGLGVLAVDRGLGLNWPLAAFAIPAGLGVLIGALTALRRIPGRMEAAVSIDRQMRLKDQFGSAEALLLGHAESAPQHDAAFAEMVRREADRLASSIDVRTATPIRVTRAWGGGLALALFLWMGALFVPSRPVGAEESVAAESDAQQLLLDEQREEIAAAIDDTLDQFDTAGELDPRLQEEIEALSRLADQLKSENADDLDVEQVRDESAARLTEIADRLAEQARRDLAAREDLTRRFAGMPTPETPSAALELTDALKHGDFDQAADLMDEMTGGEGKLSDEERRLVGEHLRSLSEQLDESGDADQLRTDERAEQIEQALRDQGFDDTEIDSLLEETPEADELQRTLQENDVDQEVARDLARDLEQLDEQRSFDEQIREDAERIAEALDRAADQVEQPEAAEDDAVPEPEPAASDTEETAAPPDGAPSDREDTSPDQAQEGTPPNDQQNEDPDATPAGQDQPATPPTATPDQTPPPQTVEQQQTGEQQQQSGKQQDSGEQPPEQTGTPQQSQQQQEPSGDRPGAQEQQVADPEQPGAQEQQVGDPDQPGEQQQQVADPEQPGEQQQQIADPEQPGAQEQQQQTEGAEEGEPPLDPEQIEKMMKLLERMPSSALRELAERAREAQRNREISDQMKEQARRMVEQMSDEQRQRWMDLLQQQRPPDDFFDDQDASQPPSGSRGERLEGDAAPAPPAQPSTLEFDDTEDVDIRGQVEPDQIIAEWLSDQPLAGEPGRTDRPGRTRRIRTAQEVAERAVNDSAVPPRYHEFIKRYFNNLNRTVQKATGDATPPAGDPPPANPPKPPATGGPSN